MAKTDNLYVENKTSGVRIELVMNHLGEVTHYKTSDGVKFKSADYNKALKNSMPFGNAQREPFVIYSPFFQGFQYAAHHWNGRRFKSFGSLAQANMTLGLLRKTAPPITDPRQIEHNKELYKKWLHDAKRDFTQERRAVLAAKEEERRKLAKHLEKFEGLEGSW